ncbi:molybdenum cofactor synthesis domain-containing protein [Candidatus Magnetobacterium bavaricum]|uniref:Molybdenum cofactor synthesis domain-containing protein n=1 Tax=Candidatus Magnetobacterium bavaricum TaxID=29290 RepID=A0A0F3GR64_9BACT|nr:molybdenum cofactor synthesis domain-containing protein [Candidatus Magnetobacterium bavaricum]
MNPNNITAAVVTVSDKGSSGQRVDESGPVAIELLRGIGCEVLHCEIVPDERDVIRQTLVGLSDRVDLIITSGGTGLSPRDVTPEATLDVIDREIPGIAEQMRAEGMRFTRRSMLSRGVAGVRGATLIINLPGSPKAVRENLRVVIDVILHAVEKIKGGMADCARQ